MDFAFQQQKLSEILSEKELPFDYIFSIGFSEENDTRMQYSLEQGKDLINPIFFERFLVEKNFSTYQQQTHIFLSSLTVLPFEQFCELCQDDLFDNIVDEYINIGIPIDLLDLDQIRSLLPQMLSSKIFLINIGNTTTITKSENDFFLFLEGYCVLVNLPIINNKKN